MPAKSRYLSWKTLAGPRGPGAVDTRSDPELAWRARGFWTDVSRERIAAKQEATYWYNVFAVSEADLERIRELQAAHFRQLRTLIARSEPAERVVLSLQHLVPLDAECGN